MSDHIVDSNKKVIDAAREAGWSDLQLQMASPAELDRLAAFYRLAYRAGMERAAEICEGGHKEARPGDYAYAIRTHAKNQPESTHDDGVM